MNMLKLEREVLEKYLPGLDEKLCTLSLMQLESRESPALKWFREAGGPSLMIAPELGGKGVSPVDMIRIQRALGSRSASLALATNMHTCTIAAVPPCEAAEDLLKMVAKDNLFIASGFSEGKPATSIQIPSIQVETHELGVILNGSKKPCSLSLSMDIFTASVLITQDDGSKRFALVNVPASSEGLSVNDCFNSDFLQGAENMEVVLNNVFVPNEYISYFGEELTLTQELSYAFLWFELYVSASYLGVVSQLVEKLYQYERCPGEFRVNLVTQLEALMLSLEGVGHHIMEGNHSEDAVSKSLMARFNAQSVIADVAAKAAEGLGGMSYMASPDISYLLKVSRALAFHPPSKWIMNPHLDQYVAGNILQIP